jgi:8-oxo-dGTP diphosphatase
MVGYRKGTTPAGEMQHVREAFASAAAAIKAWPDAAEAMAAAAELGDLTRELQTEAADFRGYLAAYLADYHGLSITEMAAFLGKSRPRASQIINRARERGNPVTEPTSVAEPLPVVLAIITSDEGVLVAKRRDGIPPWVFPGGEIQPGESSGEAARRRVAAEAGMAVESTRFIGRRVHPKTSRLMVYVHAAVAPGADPSAAGDPEDIELARWASVDETRDLMPDMYGPVRQYLDQLQLAQQASG